MSTIRVGSAAVIYVNPMQDKIVLIKSAKEPYRGLWVLPGGGVDFGETLEQAVCREVQEELGVNIRVTRYLTHREIFEYMEHRIVHFHIALTEPGQVRVSSEEWTHFRIVSNIDTMNMPIEDLTPTTHSVLKQIGWRI